ncbi:MAG: DNA replication/repair protein RecF [Lawsonibacter sp.]|nr:DNA replication/repair protein RecF [Lawsonibacter sp.]
MNILALALENFRNYAELEVHFDPRVNLIYGDNAQGKTNLLEAIAYLSAARSHRARYDREMIRLESAAARILGTVSSRGRQFRLEARLLRGQGRQLKSNGVRLKTAGELAGILNTVLFCPEDLQLIREGAAARRRFLDGAICQLRPRYAQALAEYGRLYEHKTRILRDWPDNPSLLQTLDDFSLRMAQTGALLIHYRAHFVKRLRASAPAIHADFSGGRETLGLDYTTVSTLDDPLEPPQKLLPPLLEHQRTHRQAELDARQCLSGPHKDDLAVSINGQSAKIYGSQGQTRTAALSLKLAQREIFQEETGEWPVLLLDDVLSELDARRQAFVLNRIRGGQVFITCCEEEKLEGLEGGKAFHIQNGRLME